MTYINEHGSKALTCGYRPAEPGERSNSDLIGSGKPKDRHLTLDKAYRRELFSYNPAKSKVLHPVDEDNFGLTKHEMEVLENYDWR